MKASTEQQKFGKKFVFFPRKGLYFSNMIIFIAPEDICQVVHNKNPLIENRSPSGLQVNLIMMFCYLAVVLSSVTLEMK
ncbi:hypothetical protein DFQ00_109147 [Paenibacillus barcinonensis]|uniref:Uncharacterized protein n=1 Tax=Paenibacillus barcinonensis TaxID=198119 RepID=A0A2V4VPZ9_PAEBA|nr:hypothetical protein DFQ00_109147 [Paenibacillus barcinonensis]